MPFDPISFSKANAALGLLTDLGAPSAQPFVVLAGGQSNMQGVDTGGSKTIDQSGGGIWIVNANLGGTALVRAAFGQAPLALSAGGGASDGTANAATACNNFAVHFANAVRASGAIDAARPIIIIPNWLGGRSISYWVGSGTGSDFWVNLLTSLAVVEAAYPGFTIDHALWWQGENDSSLSGTYGSYDTYDAAFTTLLAQWRALPQWTDQTTISINELAAWYSNSSGAARNDVIRSYRKGLRDPLITVCGVQGLTESTQSPGPHIDGASQVIVGKRHFAAWREARLLGSYADGGGLNARGGARVLGRLLTVATGGTLNVGVEDFLQGGLQIIANGGTLNLPAIGGTSSPLLSAGRATVLVQAATTVTAQSVTNANTYLHVDSLAAGQTTFSVPGGTYELFIANGDWWLTSVWPKVGNVVAYSQSISGAYTLDAVRCRNASFLLNGATITLPSPTNGGFMVFYGDPAGTASTLNDSNSVNADGNSVGSYTVNPGATVLLFGQGAKWQIALDSGIIARRRTGTTANRPTLGTTMAGTEYLDTTLNKPIWWTGAAWIDATGATV